MAVRTRTIYRMSVELQEDTFVELYRDTFVELLVLETLSIKMKILFCRICNAMENKSKIFVS